jgi:hypothetical protein
LFPVHRDLALSRLALRSSRRVLLHQRHPALQPGSPVRVAMTAVVSEVLVLEVAGMIAHAVAAKASVDR